MVSLIVPYNPTYAACDIDPLPTEFSICKASVVIKWILPPQHWFSAPVSACGSGGIMGPCGLFGQQLQSCVGYRMWL